MEAEDNRWRVAIIESTPFRKSGRNVAMIANMNEKGRQTKLLAAVAVFAMVVCALAVVMPSADAEPVSITQDATTDYGTTPVDIGSSAFSNAVTNSNYTVTVVDGFTTVELTANQTWNLTENVVISNGTLDLNGNNLKITGDGTLSVTFNDPTDLGAALMSNDSTDAANVYIDGTTVTFIGSGERENGAWSVDAMNISQFVVANEATLNVEKRDSGSVGTLWHTDQSVQSSGSLPKVSGNSNVLFIQNSTVNFTNTDPASAGVQNTAIVATNSEINSVLNGGSMAVYADLTDSKIKGDIVNLYAANLKGTSSIEAMTLGGYSMTSSSGPAYSGFTLGTVSLSATSSIKATTITNGFSNYVSGTQSINFVGATGTDTATVSGELTAPWTNTTAQYTANYSFSNVNVSGITVSEEGTINVSKTDTSGSVSATVDPSGISAAFTNDADVVTVNSGTISGSVSGITGELVIGSGVTLETTTSGGVVTGPSFTLETTGSVTIGASNDTFSVTGAAGASVTFRDVSGNITVSSGSVTIDGTEGINGGTFEITGEMKIFGSLTGDLTLVNTSSGSMGIPTGETFTIEEGARLTLEGWTGIWYTDYITDCNGTLEIKGTIASDSPLAIASNYNNIGAGQIKVFPSANLSNITLSGNISYETDDISYEFRGRLDQNITISSQQSLAGDLYIPNGYTLTIAPNGVLNLNGYGIYVEGTLAVEANGVINNLGSDKESDFGNGVILLHRDGTVTNNGVIGSGSEVTVSAAIEQGADAYNTDFANGNLGVNYTGVGSVVMQNVSGVTFSITNDNSVRYLTVTGDVYTYGMTAPYTISATDVYVSGDMTIGEDVVFSANTGATANSQGVVVRSSATLTVNGTLNAGEGNLVMKNNSTVVVEGLVTGKVCAETGTAPSAGYSAPGHTDVSFQASANADYVTGVTLTVGQYSYTESNVAYTEQRLYISGSVDAVDADSNNTAQATLTIDNSADVSTTDDVDETGKSYVAEDATLSIGEGLTVVGDSTVVLGAIDYVVDNSSNRSDRVSGFIGTGYTIEGASASEDDVRYITTFANAYGQIANAYRNEITIYGDLEIDVDVDLASGQRLTINDSNNVTITVAEDATLSVQRGGIITGTIDSVEGVMTLYNGAGANPPASYVVYKQTTEYRQYSGLVPAIEGAQPGDVINVQNNATIRNDMNIPAGVTVNNNAVLTFMEDLTVEETAVLNNDGTIYMVGNNSTLAVNGTLDSSEGAVQFANLSNDTYTAAASNGEGQNRSMTSIGTTIVGSTNAANGAPSNVVGYISAAYYTNDDGYTVYTNVAAAVAGIEAADNQVKTVYVTGTLNQSADITLAAGTSLIIIDDARVTLGTVTLIATSNAAGNGSGVTVLGDGQLTATIEAMTGTADNQTTSSIDMNRAAATIEMISNTSSANVKTDYMVIGGTVAGTVTIASGTVNAGTLTVSGTTMTVSTGAILAVQDVTGAIVANLTAGTGQRSNTASVVVEGTIVFGDGNLDLTGGIMNVSGTMTVADRATITVAGTLNLTGDLNISTTENREGSVNVTGTIVVGDRITSVGGTTTGSISGAVETDSGVIKAYNGADLSNAQIDIVSGESEAESTAFYVNGQLYMTVYSADSNENPADILHDETFQLTGYVTESTNPALDINSIQYWYTDADMSQSASGFIALGEPAALYFRANAAMVNVAISVGEGISLYIDGIRYTTGTQLSVGTHTVEATVNPGFSGDVTIYFNGTPVTGGQFTITPVMASNAYEGVVSVSATGNITSDSGSGDITVNVPKDDGMSLTDILLIVLVILILVMAIIVALRLMRS